MKNKKLKWVLGIGAAGILTAAIIVYLMFNTPHRDIQSIKTDYNLNAEDIVAEYLTDKAAANEKYLNDEGESKVIAVTGKVLAIDVDMNNQKVVLLEGIIGKAGVSCTFTESSNLAASSLAIGEIVTIKGVIRSGANYDEDLELYEDVILEKCDVITI